MQTSLITVPLGWRKLACACVVLPGLEQLECSLHPQSDRVSAIAYVG